MFFSHFFSSTPTQPSLSSFNYIITLYFASLINTSLSLIIFYFLSLSFSVCNFLLSFLLSTSTYYLHLLFLHVSLSLSLSPLSLNSSISLPLISTQHFTTTYAWVKRKKDVKRDACVYGIKASIHLLLLALPGKTLCCHTHISRAKVIDDASEPIL